MFKNPFSPLGRITRTEISLSYFFSFIVGLFWALFFWVYKYDFPILFFAPPLISLFWFLICQGTKRCHDIGNPGLFQFIPFYFMVMIFKEGEMESNQYGLDPKKAEPIVKNFFSENFKFSKPGNKSWAIIVTEFFGLVFFTMTFLSLLIYFFEHNQLILFYASGIAVIVCYYIFLLSTKVKEHILIYPSYFFYERLSFAVLLISLFHFYFYYFRDVVIEEFNFFSKVFVVFNVLLLTYLSFQLFKKGRIFKVRLLKLEQLVVLSVLFFALTVLIGFNTKGTYEDGYISWSEQKLEWNDFRTTFFFLKGFDASIHSSVQIPKQINQDEFLVFAYMIPNKSFKVANGNIDDQLLVHEQYHFNITEYVSREMRKELISMGKQNISLEILKNLKLRYSSKIDSIQSLYDFDTKHNRNYEKQRYWELKIDDLLRQTAYYTEADLMKYYTFNPTNTTYYRKVTQNFYGDVLVSYPVSEFESLYGKVYKVVKNDNNTTVTYFENGIKKNDGYFENAITTIIKNKNSLEINYINDEAEFNDKLNHAIEKKLFKENGDVVLKFFDESGVRITSESIFEIQYKNISPNNYLTSYFNINNEIIKNSSKSFHEKRTLDNQGRLIKQEAFDRDIRPILNDLFVSVYENLYDENNNIIQQKRFDSKGEFSYGIDAFNITYIFDERGNLSRIKNRDKYGSLRNDNTGCSLIVYDYDLRDNIISLKRYNQDQLPTWGVEEYFQMVTDYDSLGRKLFSATYYPEYVLKFDENMWGASRFQHINDTTRLFTNIDAYNQVVVDIDSVSHIMEITNSKQQVVEKRYYNDKKHYFIKENVPVIYLYKYDERGNSIEEVSLDSLLNRMPFQEDVALVRWEFDQNNNKVKTSYFNINGDLANANQNASFNFFVYDKNNNLIERTNYDKHEQPIEIDEIFKHEIIVNQQGNDSIVKKYNAANKLKNGISIEKYFYDEYQNLIAIKYYDKNNRPVLNEYGSHKIEYLYDKYSRYIGEKYFDVKLKPINDIDGYHHYLIEYDNKNYRKSESYFSANGKKINTENGYHKIEYLIDKDGLISRTTYLDSFNNKIDSDIDIADILYQRFPSGKEKRISFYNDEGYLINDSEGVAEYFYEASLNGLYYISKLVDSDGNIIKDNDEI